MARGRSKREAARRSRPGVRLGVIGGSGLYRMPGLERPREVRVRTPFGRPSDSIVVGRIAGETVAFLPRHGRGHRFLPGEIPFRANVFALKSLGVELVLAVGAVGSLRKGIRPGDVVVADQFIDRTRTRPSTFFGDGIVAHVSCADPVCPDFSSLVAAAAVEDRRRARRTARVHRRGTYLCMEGPQFSTRAESSLYRQWKADVIGMTNVQEAKLAREAEMCFAALTVATDYDCWNVEAGDVDIAEVLRILAENTERVQSIVRWVAERLPAERSCRCATALAGAIITDPARIPASARRRLAPLAGKYLGAR